MCIDGEDPSVIWVTNPIARKEHRCCECLSVISPGEKYELVKGVWNGEFLTFKTCQICAIVRDAANLQYRWGETIPFTCLWETVGCEYEEVI